ncbi:MAG TPA: Fe-S cluster assembly protein SufD [Gemmatimonadales bacterium]|nr:Fe-S cluster assembly protein SufD [Gemmatimonadales bacterium]
MTDVLTEVVTPAWLEPVRRAGAERFEQVGFPTTRDEEWRFTPVAPIAQTAWQPAPGVVEGVTRAQLEAFEFGHPEWHTLVFVNGAFSEALSSMDAIPETVRVASLAEALRDGSGNGPADVAVLEAHLGRHAPVEASPFVALNAAAFRDGGFVHVPAGVELERPVHLVFVTTAEAEGTAAQLRNLIVLGRGARAAVVESYVSLAPEGRSFTNVVTEVVADRASWLEHTRLQREAERAYHVGFTHADQQRDSHYRHFSMQMGGALARHNHHVRLNDEAIETLMYGLYLTRGEQLVDNHTAIFHDQPNCNSWEVYKGILDDRSRAVFNGKVFVQPAAQKTDAKQTNRNVLLSPGASVDTKPQLEIFADDVKCTHGATVGFLDPVALFYAKSRGIPAAEAQRLLTYAFAAEVVDEVALEPVRAQLNRLVLARLNGEA